MAWLHDYRDAWNGRDGKRVAAFFDDDGVHEHMALQSVLARGPATVVDRVRRS